MPCDEQKVVSDRLAEENAVLRSEFQELSQNFDAIGVKVMRKFVNGTISRQILAE